MCVLCEFSMAFLGITASAKIRKTFTHSCMSYGQGPLGVSVFYVLALSREPVLQCGISAEGGSLEEVAVEVDLKAQRIPAAGLGVSAVQQSRLYSTARAEEPHPFSSSPLAL